MKKHLTSLLIAACLGTISWAQGNKELFDTKKSAQELEVMKGILGTTLGFAAQEGQQKAGTSASMTVFRGTTYGPFVYSYPNRISAYYLYGQGAVFVVPGSLLARGAYSLGSGSGFGIGGGVGVPAKATMAPPAPPAPAVSPATPVPPTPPPPPAPTQASEQAYKQAMEAYQAAMKSMEQRLKELEAQYADRMKAYEKSQKERDASLVLLQQQLEKDQKDVEARRQRLNADIGTMKASIIETLANYGDSLTTVKPNEYINVVIIVDGSDGTNVVSAQKSWITDFKAGRLTLDAFKQKVLQYSE